MAEMAWIEKAFCRSAAWRAFTRKVVVPWALQGCEPQGIALEIGAGSGAMAAEILSLHPRLEMVVTDFDESMLSGARETLAQFSERAEIRTADATALPFEDSSFDALFSFIMLHHVVKWEEALGEAARVLKPGGRLIAYDLLSTGIMRLLHGASGSYHRIMELEPLAQRLSELPFRRVMLRPGLLRFVVRVTAIKTETKGGQG